ncbi:DUF2513 domain-containing protein [Franconibacter helveticus]|uniref:DUF2513 domain-containing protein n=1 Tax=Franconibacter helveticus TaxID=357240 RepID=UPI000DA2596D|nr:DUF2513 domain-containing protein [Franconibacter helveticus]
MKINQDYIKVLLCAFEETEGPDTLLTELENKGYQRNDGEFIFHMRLLTDNKLIERVDGEGGFGHLIYSNMVRGINTSEYHWIIVPLRLTAKGHDFLSDIRQKEVWQAIKANFKEQGLGTLTSIAKSLAEAYAKKSIKNITGIDI